MARSLKWNDIWSGVRDKALVPAGARARGGAASPGADARGRAAGAAAQQGGGQQAGGKRRTGKIQGVHGVLLGVQGVCSGVNTRQARNIPCR